MSRQQSIRRPVDDSTFLTMCVEVLTGLVLWALFGWIVIWVIDFAGWTA